MVPREGEVAARCGGAVPACGVTASARPREASPATVLRERERFVRRRKKKIAGEMRSGVEINLTPPLFIAKVITAPCGFRGDRGVVGSVVARNLVTSAQRAVRTAARSPRR